MAMGGGTGVWLGDPSFELRFLELVESRNYNYVEYFISEGVNVNCVDKKSDNNALIKAVANLDFEMVKLLCKHGIELNHQNCAGNTALICAAYGEKYKIVEFLVDQGADISIKNSQGVTAWDIANSLGSSNIKAILEAKMVGVPVVEPLEKPKRVRDKVQRDFREVRDFLYDKYIVGKKS